MVPLLPNSLFTSLHALLEANGVALIASCKIPGRREELLSLVGAWMFQCLALCLPWVQSKGLQRKQEQPWLCFKALLRRMDLTWHGCLSKPRNQQTKKALGWMFLCLALLSCEQYHLLCLPRSSLQKSLWLLSKHFACTIVLQLVTLYPSVREGIGFWIVRTAWPQR